MNNQVTELRIGTRGSQLARIQTAAALDRLRASLPGLALEEVVVSTPGDRDRESDLRDSPPDFFTRDLDEQILSGTIDAAIHSAKDLPETMTEGIDWCWLPWREDPRDALVLLAGKTLDGAPAAPRIGISSERREAFAAKRFPDAKLLPIRGNIDERLAAVDDGQFDIVIMATAALNRMGLADRVSESVPLEDLPVPEGQGSLAMTFRSGDERLLKVRSLCVKSVVFAGAGAGSAGECTLWAVRALQRADVCLYDALLDPALLEFLPQGARRVDVGKRCGRVSPPQDEISQCIAEYARRGCKVVRLKGGDPGIFGRLAEEIECLDALQLPYRVIPGVSSLSTATTGTGILLTRRGVSRGFTAITPRLQGGDTASVGSKARAELPIALMMATSMAGDAVDELKGEGMSAGTPVAAVFGAGTDDEIVVEGTLNDIASKIASRDNGDSGSAPGIMIVGEVARYRFSRRWGALEGRRVLLTGSEALQDTSAELVSDYGGLPIQRPLIRLVTTEEADASIGDVAKFDWLVLTSPSAVRCFFERLQSMNLDLRQLPRMMVAGAGTAKELASHGLKADLMPAGKYSAESMIEEAQDVIESGTTVLRLRSDKAGASLAEALIELGAVVTDCVLYRNERIDYDRLPAFEAAFFASTSAVESFDEQWGVENLAGKRVVAIGKPTVEALEKRGVRADIVGPEATVDASLTAFAEACVSEMLSTLEGR